MRIMKWLMQRIAVRPNAAFGRRKTTLPFADFLETNAVFPQRRTVLRIFFILLRIFPTASDDPCKP
jgi:hypothetical protein